MSRSSRCGHRHADAVDEVDLGNLDSPQRRRHLSRRGRAPTSGTWRVQVSLRIDEFENPVASLSLPRAPGWTVDRNRTVCRKPSTRTCTKIR